MAKLAEFQTAESHLAVAASPDRNRASSLPDLLILLGTTLASDPAVEILVAAETLVAASFDADVPAAAVVVGRLREWLVGVVPLVQLALRMVHVRPSWSRFVMG